MSLLRLFDPAQPHQEGTEGVQGGKDGRVVLPVMLPSQFEPLPGTMSDQWGSITLNYRLDGP